MLQKIKFLLAILWGILIFVTAVSVEIAWLTFLIGSVLGVILMLIFFPTGFLLPFNFIMSFGLFSGIIGNSVLNNMKKSKTNIEDKVIDVEIVQDYSTTNNENKSRYAKRNYQTEQQSSIMWSIFSPILGAISLIFAIFVIVRLSV